MEGRGFAVLQVFFLFSLCDLHYVSFITLAHVDWHEQHSSLLPSFFYSHLFFMSQHQPTFSWFWTKTEFHLEPISVLEVVCPIFWLIEPNYSTHKVAGSEGIHGQGRGMVGNPQLGPIKSQKSAWMGDDKTCSENIKNLTIKTQEATFWPEYLNKPVIAV